MMTYDQRMAEVSAWMQEPDSLFQRRDPPKRLQRADKDEQRKLCRAELHVIAEAIVRAAPVIGLTDFQALIRAAGRRYELEAKTATWPLPPEMADAIKAEAPAPQSTDMSGGTQRPLTDREREQVAAIEGRHWGDVSAFWITGLGGRQLLEAGHITAADVRAFEDWRRERDGAARAQAAGRVK